MDEVDSVSQDSGLTRVHFFICVTSLIHLSSPYLGFGAGLVLDLWVVLGCFGFC